MLGILTLAKCFSLEDVSEVFNYLTGYSKIEKFNKLFVSPINTRTKFLELIQREIENKKSGGTAHIIFKFNSLVDPILIAALYEASNNGVTIDLIVRGICCLKPQVPGLSENINVISIVGRYLEHSRIYYFNNNGDEEIYLSSADLMPRNIDRRVEDTFPILDSDIKNTIIENILKVYLKDNFKGRLLGGDGVYNRLVPKNNATFSVQDFFMEYNSELRTKN